MKKNLSSENQSVEIGKKLKEHFDKLGYTQQYVADKLGVSQAAVSALLNGKPFGKKLANKWAEMFGLKPNWLLTGEGEMFVAKFPTQGLTEETRPRIPMTAVAGTLTGFTDSIALKDCEQIPVIKALPRYDYTMIVKGDSMEPKFEGGDEIALRKVTNVIEWGKTYVLDTRDGAVLKRLYDAGDDYRCVSYNKDYPDFKVGKADVFGVYKVVGLIRI